MPFVDMDGWSEERRMAHHASVRKEYYDTLGVDPDTCTMDAVTEAVSPAEVRPTPPPALAMDASGLPSDYDEWPESTRKYYLRSTMSPCSQKRLYGNTDFVFEDPGAKYKVEIKTLTSQLHNETTKNNELERERMRDLAAYTPTLATTG